MAARIFDVENGLVVYNEIVLLVPEFNVIVEKYKTDAIPILSYVYFMTVPDSPYLNLPEADRPATIIADVGAEIFDTEDILIKAAVDKAALLYHSRTQRLYESAGRNLDRLGKYLDTEEIKGGMHGNLGEIFRIQTGLSKIVENYKKLEKLALEEFKANLRGGGEAGRY